LLADADDQRLPGEAADFGALGRGDFAIAGAEYVRVEANWASSSTMFSVANTATI
jgi:hypothetical protein